MPFFFFDIVDDGVFSRDDYGVDLPGVDEARDQAIDLIPDVVRTGLADGARHTVTCSVRDEPGRVIYRGTLTYEGGRPEDGS
ncbi:DUF6894 family protein [Lichenibacterium dinghuense]|uniref:DUF6894 family protein n=1 Tax=Lichenibacterium dinghuense TaxID=2895977 RepID=UPI001F1F7E89|nr:hypothetical protein [Lichenibacterium sp. 6Y81]